MAAIDHLGRQFNFMRSGKTNSRSAVIFDVDGTLADVSGIEHHVTGGNRDFHKFHEASVDVPPHEHVARLARAVHQNTDHHVLVVTARSDKYRPHTVNWLHENRIPYTDAYFRPEGDSRPDYEVKSDILAHIRKQYEPVAAVDDNPSVLKLWREKGIPSIRVGQKRWDER